MAAGVGTATMDAVYINNVMTLLYDQQQVLKELARVLKPGGLLVLETVFADRKRDEDVVEQARRLGEQHPGGPYARGESDVAFRRGLR